jgi:uncharacterized protein YndB with AHSA1/START domain
MNMIAVSKPYAVETAPATVTIERLLPGPAERLWSYLVDADKRKLWFSAGDTLRDGAAATLLFKHSNITDEPTPDRWKGMDKGGIKATVKVTEFDPPRVLAYTWPNGEHESEVRFELFPEGGKVRLVLTHERLKDMDEQVGISSGWHAHLDALADVLAGRKPQGFWANVLHLEKEYTERYGAGR